MTTNPQTDARAADLLVADARRAVHESLIVFAAPEADRVRALIADLETAVEGRTAIHLAAVSVPASAPTDEAAEVEERTARYLFDQDWTRTLDVDAARKLLAAVLPARDDQAADWGALVRETGRLRLEAIELHDQAADIDARVAEFELRGTAEIRAAALTEAADFLRDAHFRDGLSVQEIGTAMRHWADRERAAAVSGPHDTDDATGQAEPRVVDWAEIDRRTAQSGIDTPGCDCGHDGMGASWHSKDCEWRSAPPCDHCGVRGHSVEDCPRDEQPAVVSQPDEEA